MITRVLIANRGEIALRIVRACREIGIESVAVYSDADARSPHVAAADFAERIGPAAARESYLNIAAILAAAAASGSDAVHPGYGFLSQNPAFAGACAAAGLTFIGPPVEALERMGSKIGARRLMMDAGVPVVPGETPANQSDEALVAAVRHVGFPAMLKPSAGGGGIGMRVLRAESELAETIAAARREARAAFGDDTLYVERLIEQPRHVEIQVLADNHGQIVHIFERECSAQRRHQKTIEESPCPVLTPRLRERMGAAAVAAARAAGYRNAGTVEFLVQGDEHFFIEMNARLQVEHPVTECVAGIDLVHAQLRIAAGKPLGVTQASLSQRGHAIECRVYAEDPAAGFLPQAGTIVLYREPHGPGIRVDSGITAGLDVSVHYDPLLAKLIVWAEDREAARRRAIAALRQFAVLGIRTNISFLLRLLEHPAFIAGRIDTGFLDREGEALAQSIPDPPEDVIAVAIRAHQSANSPGGLGVNRTARTAGGLDPFTTLKNWRG
jgi:acetyl-CoA/propionyl-CoA carboxylase biotin carboxyl carrier protein